MPEERRWACRRDRFHLATHSGSGAGISCYATVSPLHRLLTEAPPALKAPELRLQGSATGLRGAPKKKAGLLTPGLSHRLLLLFPGFLEYSLAPTLRSHRPGTAGPGTLSCPLGAQSGSLSPRRPQY